MEYVYRTQGTCSTNIELNVEEVIKKLEGVRCSGRPTSCPDQLCHALHEMGY